MDYLWRVLNFKYCSEELLVIVLALFIIGTCIYVDEEHNSDKNLKIYTPSLFEIETAEDLFYETLCIMYTTYMTQ